MLLHARRNGGSRPASLR